jgi:uncharacterized protein (DUF1810 family)
VPLRPTSRDPFDLQRFVSAQEHEYDRARAELAEGCKRGHWMWYIFPQLRGLGNSELSRRYAISSLDEAKAYLQHPVLGTRLRECTRLVNGLTNRSAVEIFGSLDALKFRSCVTLFAEAGGDDDVFMAALTKYFEGEPDPLTLEKLQSAGRRF